MSSETARSPTNGDPGRGVKMKIKEGYEGLVVALVLGAIVFAIAVILKLVF
jgi:hypothetical protein